MQKDVYELTHPQKSIWDMEQYYKGNPINNICGQAFIHEKVDFDTLKEAFKLFFQFYDNISLRFFIDEKGVPKQYFKEFSDDDIDIELVDLKDVSNLPSLAKRVSTQHFEIIESKLYNIVFFRFPDGTGGFLVCAHHLLFDAWSAYLLCNKIIEFYSHLIHSESVKNNSYSYISYINEEKNYLNSSSFEKDKSYWLEKFKDVPEAGYIPTLSHHASPQSNSIAASRKSFTVSEDKTNKIKAFCKELSISPFNLFVGALSVCINGFTNMDNFTIGTPILNRLNHLAKQTTGMYISTLPINIDIDSKLSFRDFIINLRNDSMGILRHQRYPYQVLLEELRKNNKQLPNLYKILLSYQISEFEETPIDFDTTWISNDTSPDEIQIHVQDHNYMNTLILHYDYRLSLYSEEEIENLNKRILYVIDQVIDNADVLISDISIALEEEKKLILNSYNNQHFSYDKTKTYVDFFKEQVKKTPNEVALVFEDKKMTYKELDDASNKVANYLIKSKVKKNSIVGICLERSLEIIVSIIGSLKAGCAYLPIDVNYPKDRIQYIFKDSNCSLLLINKDSHLARDVKSVSINDILSSDISVKSTKVEIQPADSSYIIYTSGSTGNPKGVILNHLALTNLINYCNETIEYLKDKKAHTIISVTTISFDIFIFETLISLQKGLKVVIANTNEQLMPRLLNDLIIRNQAEAIQMTPSRMNVLLDNISDIPSLKQLKYITLAGEPFTQKIQESLKKIIPNVVLYNGYGPSETTVFATLSDITDENPISIGKPIFNNNIYIMNKNLQLLPPGYTGELYISGDNVGAGYINRPTLTAELFSYDIFNHKNRMYKSGDLGYYLPDGRIMCEGRLDNQIKIRGQRIELSEIENHLSNIDGINKCVVLKKIINNQDEVLCAYYTESNNIEANYLRDNLMKKLPMYMIPQYFIKLQEMPYTPNGKINKKALEKIDISNSSQKNLTTIINPSDEIELKLVEIVKKVTNSSVVSMDSNFIGLGGDSLSAINLSIELFAKFKVDIPVREIINSGSLIELANYIKKSNQNLKYNIKKVNKQPSYPLSSAQSRIYYATRLISNNNLVYNISGGIIIDGIIDNKKIEKIFNKIIELQPSFRTQFIVVDSEIRQEVLDKVTISVEVTENTEENIRYLVDNYPKPFDLSKAPLLRVHACYIDHKKTLILIDSHHIVMDGSSIDILGDMFVKLYNGEELEPLEIEYTDYSVWENKYIESDYIKDSENYWINKLSDRENINLALPYDYNNSNKYVGEKITKKLNTNLINKIDKYCSSNNVSQYMFYMSAFFILLYKYTGQKDIVVGTPSANRPDIALNNIIGMFVNDLSIRGKIDNNDFFKNFVTSMKDQIISDLQYGSYPYDLLLKKLNLSNEQLFDVMFTFQNTKKNTENTDNALEYQVIPSSINISKFNLSIEIDPYLNTISLEYSSDLFKRSTIENMYKNYMNLMSNIISHPDSKIQDLKILSQNDEKKIMYQFNSRHLACPSDKTVKDLFSIQVKKHENDVAISYKDKTLTYKDLDEKSNYIAKQIIDRNIPKGSIIGVCLNRSPELICCLLGILKANCAYMPLSSTYPAERINFIIGNSNSPLVFSNTNLSKIYNFEIESIIYDSSDEIRNLKDFTYNVPANSNDLAYVIYTSGSTGTPKGAKISHSNLINFVYNFINFYKNIDNNDSLLASTNISFDVSIWEFFLPLLTGAKLVLYEEDIIRDIIKYTDSIVNNQITTLYIPPNILTEVYDILLYKKKEQEITVNKLLVGVEPIKKTTLNKYYKINKDMIIVNGYGPTETTICCTALPYSMDTTDDDYVSIGHPLYNNNIYIMNEDKQLQPIGVPGEIYVTGDGVGLGYLNNPIENEKHFIPNTFDKASTFMYKTGDVGKWLNTGEIKFLGRNDSQVKLSGHRIELNEISSLIMAYDNINKAYTMISTQNNKKYIVSYFEASKKININKLNQYLKEKLVDYMIPSFMVQLAKFPLTANGKIDAKNLPTSFEIPSTKYVAPRNDMEKKLANIWKELLSRNEVGIDDNFFEIGGDSLSAIKFEIEALNLGLKITYSDIFSHPTIRELSQHVVKENEEINSSKSAIKDTNEIDSDYDYSSLNQLVSINNLSTLINDKTLNFTESKTNVLLLGATGFLGVHILDEFLSNNEGKVYCVVRKKGSVHSEDRLKKAIEYYFGNKYNNLFGKRIFTLKGDISEANLGLSENSINLVKNNVSTIIDSAALVKHYGNYDVFKKTNIIGTKEVIKFCKKYKKELYYVSTLSVSGTDDFDGRKRKFKENNFYIKQNLNNVYTSTKFEAEKLVLEAISAGLSAHILRLGNITNRYADGLFQRNYADNAFVNRIKAIISIGKIPKTLMPHLIEFSPVDYCAKAIVKIVNSHTKYNIFHIFNPNTISIETIIKLLSSTSIKIEPTTTHDFNNTIKSFLNNDALKSSVSGLITDMDSEQKVNLIIKMIPNADFTTAYLKLYGFEWPVIDEAYLTKFINFFKDINYF